MCAAALYLERFVDDDAAVVWTAAVAGVWAAAAAGVWVADAAPGVWAAAAGVWADVFVLVVVAAVKLAAVLLISRACAAVTALLKYRPWPWICYCAGACGCVNVCWKCCCECCKCCCCGCPGGIWV